ncbi:MAG: hypothetical protein QM731_12775 [Chitinophagaceae bacterium]
MNYRPRLFKSRLLLSATGLLLLLYLGSFGVSRLRKVNTNTTINYCVPFRHDTVPFISQVPPDVGGRYIPIGSSQNDLNTFAWWEFVALNWCDAEGGFFGKPYDTLHPVQWQTYITLDQLFPPNGTAPPAWNKLSDEKKLVQLNGKSAYTSLAVMKDASKVSIEMLSRFDSTIIDTNGAGQAAPRHGPSWLGAQNSTNVWYEIRLNKDLYDYVVKNKFYNADNQLAYVQKGSRMSLPFGTANTDTVGALELKAAWMEVNDIKNPKWSRYKLTKAIVQDMNTGQYRPVILALVGLHILHKTRLQQAWTWATFEHVDNAPDSGTVADKSRTYNFNNPSCGTCKENQPPSYYLVPGGPKPKPIQVSRVSPIDGIASYTNQQVQRCIQQFYPGSVWQYYQLVNVIWSQSGNASGNNNLHTPLNTGYLTQPTMNVANTTLESYAQTFTCFNCHRGATVAGSDTYSSDFSFSMGAASSPALQLKKNMRLKKLIMMEKKLTAQ